jgi:predicted nucleic acid-binding protein
VSVVISDTSPLNYLVQIGHEDILSKLFPSVIVPPEVVAELLHPRAPATVRTWAEKLPSWISVQASTKPLTADIDAGELAALSLAVEIGVNVVLIDDAAAREAALRLGLKPLGTLRVIELAGERGFLDLNAALTKLEKSSFRVRPELLRKMRKN